MTTDRYHNVPELAHLSPEQRSLIDLGADAVSALKRTFDHWMNIGHGLVVVREAADQRGGRKTFERLVEKAGYGALTRTPSGKKNFAEVTRLLKIVASEPEVRRWREDDLSEEQRWAWASPSSIFKHCPLFAKGGKPKPRTAIPIPRLEVAIDHILDHLHNADEDNRRAVLERLVSEWGTFVPKDDGAPTPKGKRKRKQPDAPEVEESDKTEPVELAEAVGAPKRKRNGGKLVWTLSHKANDGRDSFSASIGRVRYNVGAVIGSATKFGGEYYTEYYSVDAHVGHKQEHKQRHIGDVLDADAGKVLAQSDYDQGDAEERTRKAEQPIRIPLRL